MEQLYVVPEGEGKGPLAPLTRFHQPERPELEPSTEGGKETVDLTHLSSTPTYFTKSKYQSQYIKVS